MKKTPLMRVMAKTREEGECLIWTGYIDKTGYGRFSYDGRVYIIQRACYLMYYGHVPDGRKITTTCGNKLCIRKEHLTISDTVYEALVKKEEVSNGYDPLALRRISFAEFHMLKSHYGEPVWIGEPMVFNQYIDYFYRFNVDKDRKIIGKLRKWKNSKIAHEYFRQGNAEYEKV